MWPSKARAMSSAACRRALKAVSVPTWRRIDFIAAVPVCLCANSRALYPCDTVRATALIAIKQAPAVERGDFSSYFDREIFSYLIFLSIFVGNDCLWAWPAGNACLAEFASRPPDWKEAWHMPALGPAHGTEPLFAKCRSRNGLIVELEVLDISPLGCMVDRRTWAVKQDERVLIKFPELAFLAATVLWEESDKAG